MSRLLLIPILTLALCLLITSTSAQPQGAPLVYANDGKQTYAMYNGQVIPVKEESSSIFSPVTNFFKINWSDNAIVRSIKNLSSYFTSQDPAPEEYVEINGVPSNMSPQYAMPPNGQPPYRPNGIAFQEPPKPYNPYQATFQPLSPQQLRNQQPYVGRPQQQPQQPSYQVQAPPRLPQQPFFPNQPLQQQQQPQQMMMGPTSHQMPLRPQPLSDFAPETIPPRSNYIKLPGGVEILTSDLNDASLQVAEEPLHNDLQPLDDAYHASVVEPVSSNMVDSSPFSRQSQADPNFDFEGDNPCPVVGQWKWDGTYCVALGPMPRWACRPNDLVPTGRLAVCRNRIVYPADSLNV